MSLQIVFDGHWDSEIKASIERSLGECIGEPPDGEDWSVALTDYGRCCVVLVKATQQTRRKMFLLEPSELAVAIPRWLKIYPLQ